MISLISSFPSLALCTAPVPLCLIITKADCQAFLTGSKALAVFNCSSSLNKKSKKYYFLFERHTHRKRGRERLSLTSPGSLSERNTTAGGWCWTWLKLGAGDSIHVLCVGGTDPVFKSPAVSLGAY